MIDLQDTTRDAMKPVAEQMGALHKDFAEVLLAATIDTEAAATLISQMVEPTIQMADIKFNAELEAAQILTRNSGRSYGTKWKHTKTASRDQPSKEQLTGIQKGTVQP